MTTADSLLRWRWRVTTSDSGPSHTPVQFDFRLDDLHVPADDARFPYVEAHHLSLQWADPHYPPGVGRRHQEEKYVTEKFRRNHVDFGHPFWTVEVTERLSIAVRLAAPDRRLGDDMGEEQVFRVLYENDGHRWYVGRVGPTKGFSQIIRVDD